VISDEDGTTGLLNNLGGRALTIPSRNYLPYAHKSYVYSMLLIKGLFTHDREEEVLVSGAGDGTIKLWSLDSLGTEGLVLIHKFKNSGSNVLSLAYRGSFLFAGLSDGVANVYNLASNQLVQRLQIGHGDISQILVSTDSILCGTSQGLVKVRVYFKFCKCLNLLLSRDTTTISHRPNPSKQQMERSWQWV